MDVNVNVNVMLMLMIVGMISNFIYLVGTFVHRVSYEHLADPVRIIPRMLGQLQACPVNRKHTFVSLGVAI